MMETYRPRRVNSRVLASAAIVALVTAGGVGGILVCRARTPTPPPCRPTI